MAQQAITQLKNWFKAGLYPTEQQFADWMDSYFHKEDQIPIDSVSGLAENLGSKYNASDGATLEEMVETLIEWFQNQPEARYEVNIDTLISGAASEVIVKAIGGFEAMAAAIQSHTPMALLSDYESCNALAFVNGNVIALYFLDTSSQMTGFGGLTLLQIFKGANGTLSCQRMLNSVASGVQNYTIGDVFSLSTGDTISIFDVVGNPQQFFAAMEAGARILTPHDGAIIAPSVTFTQGQGTVEFSAAINGALRVVRIIQFNSVEAYEITGTAV